MTYKLTRTQLGWIELALLHEIANAKAEMDAAEDGSPVQALGELVVESRQHLATLINDVIYSGAKRITIE